MRGYLQLPLNKGIEGGVDDFAGVDLVGDPHEVLLDVVVLLGVQQHALQNLRELVLTEAFVILLLLCFLLLATVLQVVDVFVVGR